MRIVFELSQTITDRIGIDVRPGMIMLMEELIGAQHELWLWTRLKKEEAKPVLREHGLVRYFTGTTFREDYDPWGEGVLKDIRRVRGGLLVDSDPVDIEYVESLGLQAFQVRPYEGGDVSQRDLGELLEGIRRSVDMYVKFREKKFRIWD